MSEKDFVYADEKFADLQLLRYKLEGFESLTLQQKKYIFYLSKATLVGRDIITDQNGIYNIDIRKCLEALLTDARIDKADADFHAMEIYLKRLWFSNGIYHHYARNSFPGFRKNGSGVKSERFFQHPSPLRSTETAQIRCWTCCVRLSLTLT